MKGYHYGNVFDDDMPEIGRFVTSSSLDLAMVCQASTLDYEEEVVFDQFQTESLTDYLSRIRKD